MAKKVFEPEVGDFLIYYEGNNEHCVITHVTICPGDSTVVDVIDKDCEVYRVNNFFWYEFNEEKERWEFVRSLTN